MPKYSYSLRGRLQILLDGVIIILRNFMLKVVRLTERRCTLGLQPILRLSRLSEGCQSFACTTRFSWLLAFSSCQQLRIVLLIPYPTESVGRLDGWWRRIVKFSREFDAYLPLCDGFEGSKALNSLENLALFSRLSAGQPVASVVFTWLKVVKSVLSGGNQSFFLHKPRCVRKRLTTF